MKKSITKINESYVKYPWDKVGGDGCWHCIRNTDIKMKLTSKGKHAMNKQNRRTLKQNDNRWNLLH